MTTSSSSKPMTMSTTNSERFEQRMNKSLYSRRKAFILLALSLRCVLWPLVYSG
ncbi:Uncharacterised protein [Psychrobacter phenylpyruvicus]|uniref:Uncharacterized protein n=1 Tax=Psychrobacter phenylpyruvicus TaxID=29432 RepID=A0A379LSA2_9GAMM|nr:Uncharacterised protein [Psychrobacter phenylpyruvicus]